MLGSNLNRWLCAALLLLCARATAAQTLATPTTLRAVASPMVRERWGVAEGLPVNSITHVVQTPDGYLWVATLDGLVRFDGVRFTVYNAANSTLPSSRILRLVPTPHGDLWIITDQRHLVRLRDGHFRTILAPEEWIGEFMVLHIDPDGTVWVGTQRGLARIVNDRLEAVATAVINQPTTAILRRRNGDLVVATSSGKLWRLRTERTPATVSPVPTERPAIASPRNSLTERPDGMLVTGLYRTLLIGRDTLRALSTETIPRTVPPELANRQRDVATAFAWGAGHFRFDGDRVDWLDPEPQPVDHINSPLWIANGETWYAVGATLRRDRQVVVDLAPGQRGPQVPGNITSGLVDREGSIWLGTYADGLYRLKAPLVQTIGKAEGLATENIYGVAATRSGRIWTGGLGEGYSRIDLATGTVTAYRPRGGLGFSRSFVEDANGVLWVGGGGFDLGGLFRCNSAGEQCQPARTTGPIERAHAIFEDRDGKIWVGAATGVFRGDTTMIANVPAVAAATSAVVRVFVQSADGAIWMGTTSDGLLRYANDRVRKITTRDGLPSDLIRSLHVDADGLLWVGTEGKGLARLDTREWREARAAGGAAPRIAVINQRNGLFDNVIHQILADDQDRLWMNSNRGIFWLTRAEAMRVADGLEKRVHPVGYTEADGMRNREGNGGYQPAGARSADGRLWFPTQAGVVVIDPKQQRTTFPPQSVLVEAVLAGDTTLVPTNGALELPASLRDIRIEYTALALRDSRNLRFRYRLDGYDEDWIDAGNERRAAYTKLPAGSYTFRVQVSAPESDWYEPGATMRLDIAPRLFERPEVRIGLALLAIALVMIAVRSRIESARARARELEALVAERTTALREREAQLATQNATLEEQAAELRKLDDARTRFFANVSHELRTPLTLTLGPLESMRQHEVHDSRMVQWIDVAQRNAQRLLSLVNQILDVAKLEAGAVRLTPEPIELVAFINELTARFGPAAQKKSLGLHLELPVAFETRLDHDATEKILSNLLSNAVKFTPPGGHVHVTLSTPPGLVVISVRNTGPAIPADQLAHIFDRFYQVDESNTVRQTGTGIGLSLVKELVDLQQGVIRVTSDATGTVFVVTLPAARREPADAENAAPAVSEAPLVADEPDADDLPTLLVVDDSDDLRSFIGGAFTSRFRVLEASNGFDALTIAQTQLPDVIISDVIMPGMDGRELVRALRSSPDTDFLAVILLTAQAENAQRLAGLEGGADDYMVKPFDPRELDARVRNLLASRKRLRARYLEQESLKSPAHGHEAIMESSPTAPAASMYDAEDQQYLTRIRSAIDTGLADADFGVAELADAVFQDRTYLFRRVRELTGKSPSELLRAARMRQAARLLRESRGTVADVAFSVGYRSVSHFCRAFQNEFNCSPATYRSQTGELQ